MFIYSKTNIHAVLLFKPPFPMNKGDYFHLDMQQWEHSKASQWFPSTPMSAVFLSAGSNSQLVGAPLLKRSASCHATG